MSTLAESYLSSEKFFPLFTHPHSNQSQSSESHGYTFSSKRKSSSWCYFFPFWSLSCCNQYRCSLTCWRYLAQMFFTLPLVLFSTIYRIIPLLTVLFRSLFRSQWQSICVTWYQSMQSEKFPFVIHCSMHLINHHHVQNVSSLALSQSVSAQQLSLLQHITQFKFSSCRTRWNNSLLHCRPWMIN